MLNCNSIPTKKKRRELTDEAIAFHLQEVIRDIEKSVDEAKLINENIDHIKKIAQRNGWTTAAYFLDMAKSTFDPE